MIQIPTNARQQAAFNDAHRLRREAYASLFRAIMKKTGLRKEAGRKVQRFPRSGEILRPVCGNG